MSVLKTSLQALEGRPGNCGRTKQSHICGIFCYLKIGYGVWGGEPGSAGVLLVAKGSIEGLGDGAQIESADGRG